MADILPFKKKNPAAKAKGVTLCRSGFHKWVIESNQQFDVKQGKLITAYKCSRCGVTRTRAL